MITLLTLLAASALMLGIGIKHDEPILMAIASIFGLFVSYAYGRYTEQRILRDFLHRKAEEALHDE